MRQPSEVKHFTDLDGLRGVLALSIVFLHFGANALVQRATRGALPGITFQLAVDFFFVLSGFVLTHSMIGKPVRALAFAKRRAWRLLPVYFVTLAAIVGLGFAASSAVPYLTVQPSGSRILADFALAYPLVAVEPLNIPAWSITWELYLPIVAVAASRFVPVARLSAVLLIVALAVASVLAWRVALGEHWYGLRAAAGLLAGAMLYRQPLTASGRWLLPLLAGMAIVMAVSMRVPLIAPLFPLIACATILAGSRTQSLLSSPPAAFFGSISYTLYMVHVPVLVGALLLFGSGNIVKLGALAVSIGAAALLTATVERWRMRHR